MRESYAYAGKVGSFLTDITVSRNAEEFGKMDTAAFGRTILMLAADIAMDLLGIMMALRLMNVRIRPLCVCFGAIFAGGSAVCIRGMQLSEPAEAALWLPLAGVIMRISGGGRGFRSGIKSALTLLAAMGFLGGTVLALYGATGSLCAAYALSTAVSAAIFVITLRAVRASKDIRRVRVECVIAERMLAFDAVVDSGNSLRDYLTHRPVIVAGEAVGERLFHEGVLMRPIFADTAGGRQMMQLVMPQRTTLLIEGKRLNVKAALAFSPGLEKNAPALVPASLLNSEGES